MTSDFKEVHKESLTLSAGEFPLKKKIKKKGNWLDA